MIALSYETLASYPKYIVDIYSGNSRVDFGFETFPTIDFWKQKSEEEKQFLRPMDIIVKRLHAQLSRFDTPSIVYENIDALKTPGTLTVVTGQQVGLGGGPLLTLYKAITTIALARHLQEKSGVRTVPIFWMATSDHNIIESGQLHWINQQNELVRVAFQGQETRAPVGSMPLGSLADSLVEGLQRDLPESEFKETLISTVSEAYRPENTFALAFQQLGTYLLGKHGLVFLDPEDVEIKKACAPFWTRAAGEIDVRLERIKTRSREIEDAGYHVQAPVVSKRPAIFVHENGQRRKVVLEGRSVLAQSDIILTSEELMNFAKNEPERLSAGVTLRPHFQGYLLPTGAYVAGPHEMAYWAQLPTTFEPLGIPKPAVVQRAGFTLLEEKIKRKIENADLHYEQLFGDISGLTHELVQNYSNYSPEELFDEVRNRCGEMHSRIMNELENGPFGGMEMAVENALRKIHYQIDSLEGKFNQRLQKHHSDFVRGIEMILMHIRPAKKLQERVVSPLYYFSRYGVGWLENLIERSLDSIGKHTIVEMKELIP